MKDFLQKYVVREANEVDSEQIANVINLAFASERTWVVDPDESRETIVKDMESGKYFVAIDSSLTIVGSVLVDIPSKFIYKLSVHPSFRKKGIGQILMKAACDHALINGWKVVYICILNARTDLVEYYFKQEFMVTGEIRDIQPPSKALKPCWLIKMAKTIS